MALSTERYVSVVYSREDGKWLAETDNGQTVSTHNKKQPAINSAESRVRGSPTFENVRVFKKNPSGPSDNVQKEYAPGKSGAVDSRTDDGGSSNGGFLNSLGFGGSSGESKNDNDSGGLLGGLGSGGEKVVDDIESGNFDPLGLDGASGGVDMDGLGMGEYERGEDSVADLDKDLAHARNRRKGDNDDSLDMDLSGFD